MSRCFPYPPPSYERRRGRGEALIESIEIRKERQVETSKGKEKRERKEKRHHKKNKDQKTDFCWNSKKLDDVTIQNENEQSEKSSLTEEHDQPVFTDSLSDGSHVSSKRKRESPSSNGFERNGKVLRISFTLKKRPVLDVSIGDHHACSTSGRFVDQHAQLNNNSNEKEVNLPKCSSSPDEKRRFGVDDERSQTQSVESQYKMLIEDWVPSRLQVFNDDIDDQEWLFAKKDQTRKFKGFQAQSGVSCNGTTNFLPPACYLAEADIYALPYVTPF